MIFMAMWGRCADFTDPGLNCTEKDNKPPTSLARQPHGNKVWPFKYHSVDEAWQNRACRALGLDFRKANGITPGNRNMPLTRPDMRRVRKIKGDGNCMFRALSAVVTGSQDQHDAIRTKIVQHMRDIAPRMLGHIKSNSGYNNCQSVDEYIQSSKMDNDSTWGTDVELLCFAHLSDTCVFSYSVQSSNWNRYGPHNVDRSIPVDVSAKSIYLCHPPGHYDLVGSTVKPPNSRAQNPQVEQYNTVTLAQTEWPEYRFHCVDQQWQRDACNRLGLPFHQANNMGPGGPAVNLRRPGQTRNIAGDGNCLFRCFSYIITGSEEHYREIRSAIVAHLANIEHVLVSQSANVHNVDDYLRQTHMNRDRIWGTDKEVWALAHMLNTPVYAYKADQNSWFYQNPAIIDPDHLYHFITDPAIYLVNANSHYTPVMSISPGATVSAQPSTPRTSTPSQPSLSTTTVIVDSPLPNVIAEPTVKVEPSLILSASVKPSVLPIVEPSVLPIVEPSVLVKTSAEHSVPTVTLQPPGEHSVPTVTLQPPAEHSVPTVTLQPPGEHSVPTVTVQPPGQKSTPADIVQSVESS